MSIITRFNGNGPQHLVRETFNKEKFDTVANANTKGGLALINHK